MAIKQLPRESGATYERLEVTDFIHKKRAINLTIKIGDCCLRKYPAVKNGIIPESLLHRFMKDICFCECITDGCTITFKATEGDSTSPYSIGLEPT